MKTGRLTPYSLVLISIAYLLAWTLGYQWRANIIEYDVSRYYAYLPAIFQHQDLSFSFLDNLPESNLKDIDIDKQQNPGWKSVF
ncbi:MAG: hypothetical protein U5Q03_01925 [Bacteroidota bacterium]|nr:hypothetical protein [Bacteroidota bacterium]